MMDSKEKEKLIEKVNALIAKEEYEEAADALICSGDCREDYELSCLLAVVFNSMGDEKAERFFTAAEALLKPYLEEARNKQNVEDIYMLLTDVPKEESVVICDGRYAAGVLTDGFEIQPGADGSWTLPGVVSRKKQFIPALMTAYQEL